MFHQNQSNFRFWLPVQIWNDLWLISYVTSFILCNLKTKHRRCIKLYIFRILMTRQTILHFLLEKSIFFQRNQFLTHVELSRSMAAILEMPQYVAYQINVVYAFIKLSAKFHSFNILCTMDGLSCPTSCKDLVFNVLFLVLDFPLGASYRLLSRRILVSSCNMSLVPCFYKKLRFSDRETNLHSALGVRPYGGTGTGLLFNNDRCLRIVLPQNELRFSKTCCYCLCYLS